MHEQDHENILAFDKGNVAAFSHVYRMLYAAIFHFCYKMIDNEGQAEDIASETFIQCWNNRQSFKGLTHIKSYLYQVARNKCLNYLKHIRIEQRSHQEVRYLSKDNGDQYVDNEMINAEVIGGLYRQIKNLPTQCGKVFELYYSGKSTQEVAQELGITAQNALNQKAKAVQLLRAALLQKKLLTGPLLVFLFTEWRNIS